MQPLRVVQITLHLSGLLSFGRDAPVADASARQNQIVAVISAISKQSAVCQRIGHVRRAACLNPLTTSTQFSHIPINETFFQMLSVGADG